MALSPRQVTYSLTGVKSWLAQQNIALKVTPGVGVELDCSLEQTGSLQAEISSKSSIQLILSAGQRQQLLALLLLTHSDEPILLQSLQLLAQISRATLLKDLDEIDTWLSDWQITLVRKPNFGFLITAREQARQQALAALAWGETPFSDPLVEMTYADGLVFTLQDDAGLLPIVAHAAQILEQWNTQRLVGLAAYAEQQLGVRFTDDAVLHLSLALAILTDRVRTGHHIQVEESTLAWLKRLPVWPVARTITKKLGWRPHIAWQDADSAAVAMQLLAAPRSEIWPGDLERDPMDALLINHLLEYICDAYRQPELCDDRTLRDGLINHVIPAGLRQRFQLWFPSQLHTSLLPEQYKFENKVAGELAYLVKEHTHMDLPPGEVNNLALLLRAAIIRTSQHSLRRVVVVCPSGMATAQLLVARLETRFPHLGEFKVVSLREMSPDTAASADLVLTTVPLPKSITDKFNVIQVHPLLMPQDIDAITQFLR
jgi:mannitol operon transcriptional antiterminator